MPIPYSGYDPDDPDQNHPDEYELRQAGFSDLDTRVKVRASTDNGRLMELAEQCSVDPAEPEICLACLAYMLAQERGLEED